MRSFSSALRAQRRRPERRSEIAARLVADAQRAGRTHDRGLARSSSDLGVVYGRWPTHTRLGRTLPNRRHARGGPCGCSQRRGPYPRVYPAAGHRPRDRLRPGYDDHLAGRAGLSRYSSRFTRATPRVNRLTIHLPPIPEEFPLTSSQERRLQRLRPNDRSSTPVPRPANGAGNPGAGSGDSSTEGDHHG
jgi:hypothetical protein